MTRLPSSIIPDVRLSFSGKHFALLLVIPLVVVVSIPLVLRVVRAPSMRAIHLHAYAPKRDRPGANLPDTKRLLDMVLAAAALFFLSPVMAIVSGFTL